MTATASYGHALFRLIDLRHRYREGFMTRTSARKYQRGDRVSCMDERGIPYWGTAESGVRAPDRYFAWPTVMVRFDNPINYYGTLDERGDLVLRHVWPVPERDLEHAATITDTSACGECGTRAP